MQRRGNQKFPVTIPSRILSRRFKLYSGKSRVLLRKYYENGKVKNCMIHNHILVLLHFVKWIKMEDYVGVLYGKFKNGDFTNTHYTNLKWRPQQELPHQTPKELR